MAYGLPQVLLYYILKVAQLFAFLPAVFVTNKNINTSESKHSFEQVRKRYRQTELTHEHTSNSRRIKSTSDVRVTCKQQFYLWFSAPLFCVALANILFITMRNMNYAWNIYKNAKSKPTPRLKIETLLQIPSSACLTLILLAPFGHLRSYIAHINRIIALGYKHNLFNSNLLYLFLHRGIVLYLLSVFSRSFNYIGAIDYSNLPEACSGVFLIVQNYIGLILFTILNRAECAILMTYMSYCKFRILNNEMDAIAAYRHIRKVMDSVKLLRILLLWIESPKN